MSFIFGNYEIVLYNINEYKMFCSLKVINYENTKLFINEFVNLSDIGLKNFISGLKSSDNDIKVSIKDNFNDVDIIIKTKMNNVGFMEKTINLQEVLITEEQINGLDILKLKNDYKEISKNLASNINDIEDGKNKLEQANKLVVILQNDNFALVNRINKLEKDFKTIQDIINIFDKTIKSHTETLSKNFANSNYNMNTNTKNNEMEIETKNYQPSKDIDDYVNSFFKRY